MESTAEEETAVTQQSSEPMNNKDNPEDDVDNNEDNEGDATDMLTQMYGPEDEDYDQDSETEDNIDSDIGLNVNVNNNVETNENHNQNKRDSDSINSVNSSKRRSEESDFIPMKRTKSEPSDTYTQTTCKRLTTTIEAVAADEPPPPQIPSNSYEFMSYLLDLNPNDLEINDINEFVMSRNLQNIRETIRFTDLNDFQKIFIPYILTDLWRKLIYHYKQNQEKNANVMNRKHFLSILTKVKSNKMKNGLEMTCISVVRRKEEPVFRFGQLITIQTAVQPQPNSSTHIMTRRKYFGYIISHSIRGTNADNQSEVNHLRLLSESKRDSVIVEEIKFMTKFSEELYLRNDALIVAEPIVCIHSSVMEARTVFKFNELAIYKQIFDPIFRTKPSGLTVKVNKDKYNRSQIEMIQIGLDVIANNSLNNSCFLAINSSNESLKTSILIEMIRQIVMCKDLSSAKVLFSSSDSNKLRDIDQMLRSKKIKTYFVENDIEKSLKDFAIKHIEHKLSKEMEPQQKELYEQCLQYLDSGQEMSVDGIMFKNTIFDKLRIELMSTCSVIVGQIDHLCNDIQFYRYFTQPNHSITCCVIDDSISLSETQLYPLFWFGITKFLFGGDYSLSNNEGTDIYNVYGLSRSFFERYYRLYLENNDNEESTVFDI